MSRLALLLESWSGWGLCEEQRLLDGDGPDPFLVSTAGGPLLDLASDLRREPPPSTRGEPVGPPPVEEPVVLRPRPPRRRRRRSDPSRRRSPSSQADLATAVAVALLAALVGVVLVAL